MGGVCYRGSITPRRLALLAAGRKNPGNKTPPPIYVCKRKTWFAPVTKLSPVFVYEHRLSVFVIELFFY